MGIFHLFLTKYLPETSQYFMFLVVNLSECQWIFTKSLIFALLLRRSGSGLPMGKFCQFFSYLPVTHPFSKFISL